MKRNKTVHASGPYEVHSISQDGNGVRLMVYPAFPQYGQVNGVPWAVSREKGEGGGPSILTALATAAELEGFLNQPYAPEEVVAWKATLAEALKDVRAREKKRFERAMARVKKKLETEAKP